MLYSSEQHIISDNVTGSCNMCNSNCTGNFTGVTCLNCLHSQNEGGQVLLLQNYPHPLSPRARDLYHLPTTLNTDKGLCPLASRGEGSFVTVKPNPIYFLVGYLFHVTPGSNLVYLGNHVTFESQKLPKNLT